MLEEYEKNFIEEQKKKGYTCIPNPFGGGMLCYKDRNELSQTALNMKRCPNDFTPLEHKFWQDIAICPKCGFKVQGMRFK